jgi:hypothetical protein
MTLTVFGLAVNVKLEVAAGLVREEYEREALIVKILGALILVAVVLVAVGFGIVPACVSATTQELPTSPIKIKYSYWRGEGGSLTGRVVYDSKYRECVAPGRIRWGGDISPQFYGFRRGEGAIEVQGEFKLPRIAPRTYQRTLPGSTPIREKVGSVEYEGPLASYESVQFLFGIEEKSGTQEIITVKRHGTAFRVRCGGPGSTRPSQVEIQL